MIETSERTIRDSFETKSHLKKFNNRLIGSFYLNLLLLLALIEIGISSGLEPPSLLQMDLSESKIYLCLVALCCGPTQEDADFLRSLGTLLRVPLTEQASCITMLTAVSQSSNPFQMAEELALKLRENIDQNTALEKFCMLFLLCFHPPDASTVAKNRQMEKLYQHVQFNAKTSVIFRRLAFLLRIKLSTVTKLEAMAIEHWKIIQLSASGVDPNDDESAISAATSPTSTNTKSNNNGSKRSRRKGVIRGLKIGATAAGAGVLLGVTGGLAAPALAAGLAHIGLGAAATFTTTASVAAILGTGGAGLAGYKMNRRLKVVKTFEFHAINKLHRNDEDERDNTGMTVYVCVSGYLRSPGPVVPKLTSQKEEGEGETADNKTTGEGEEADGEDAASPQKQGRRGLFGRRSSQNNNTANTNNVDEGNNNIASSAEKTADEDNNNANEGKRRRGLFRRRGRNNQADPSSSNNRALSPNNATENKNQSTKSILRARSTAKTSPGTK